MGDLTLQQLILLVNTVFFLDLATLVFIKLNRRDLGQFGGLVLDLLDSPCAVLVLGIRGEDFLEDLYFGLFGLVEGLSSVGRDRIERVCLLIQKSEPLNGLGMLLVSLLLDLVVNLILNDYS